MKCDVLVVGGGINGTGIARDAAGRGLSVLLCEQDDLGAHTSSASTKLVHGGLRYLEHYAFALVRKALIEREVLMRSAPHLIRPLRFVMPHDSAQRPAWMIRAGLFLYDHLARRSLLPASSGVDLRRHAAGLPLKAAFTRGFAYSDGWVDDARLVLLNALDAAAHGATVLCRHRCEQLRALDGIWQATLRRRDGSVIEVGARCVVNAAGPWVAKVRQSGERTPDTQPVRLVKGSHIVVRRLFAHDDAYLFQHPDGRIVFAIPYERDFTLIGTTDIEYTGDPANVAITPQETDYLCTLCNRYFKQAITPADVVWSYAGVRPLVADAHADPSSVTRDYHFALDLDGAPMLSVFGGKITTYRRLAEEALDRLERFFPHAGPAWTARAGLPGADLFGPQPSNRAVLDFAKFVQAQQQRFNWLPAALVARYAGAYGSRISLLLDGRSTLADMGLEIVPGLFEAEAQYWIKYEWALTAEDMLWRRSKLGLHVPAEGSALLTRWLAQNWPGLSAKTH